MKFNSPLISIIIPNLNKGQFIKDTLNSLINQTYPFWEALVVDDGSTDNSVATINSFVTLDSRIKFYTRERRTKGGSVCRNIGLEKCTGDFVIFLDSDDVLLPFCVEKRVEFIQKYPTLDFAVFISGTFYQAIGDNNFYWVPSQNNHLIKFLAHELQWNIMSPIWKRDFLISLNGFDEQFPRLQDVELHTRALFQNNLNYKIAHLYPVDCYYRIDPKRTQVNHIQELNNKLCGIILFTIKFEKECHSTHQKKALRGSLFSFIIELIYYTNKKFISIDTYEEFLKETLNILKTSKLFNEFNLIVIKLYCFFALKGAWKIKGVNFLIKKIFQL